MNQFQAALAQANRDYHSHYDRAARQTRQHFQTHPDCTRKILSMDEEGNVRRGQMLIDVDARCKPGWFTRAMWKQDEDGSRPMESSRSIQRGYWYRVDDLKHPGLNGDQPGTVDMAQFMQASVRIDKMVKAAKAAQRAEVLRRRQELREKRQRSFILPAPVGGPLRVGLAPYSHGV